SGQMRRTASAETRTAPPLSTTTRDASAAPGGILARAAASAATASRTSGPSFQETRIAVTPRIISSGARRAGQRGSVASATFRRRSFGRATAGPRREPPRLARRPPRHPRQPRPHEERQRDSADARGPRVGEVGAQERRQVPPDQRGLEVPEQRAPAVARRPERPAKRRPAPGARALVPRDRAPIAHQPPAPPPPPQRQ